jgi:hypothetical protein
MEVLTQKTNRRSTRVRVEIPVMVTSLDRMRPFAEQCIALVVSCHGCGFRSSHPLPLGTPVLLSNLPGGGSVTARVANCLPLGADGKHFLIGAALYTHGNVWKVPNPPKNWESDPESAADPSAGTWPNKLFPAGTRSHTAGK